MSKDLIFGIFLIILPILCVIPITPIWEKFKITQDPKKEKVDRADRAELKRKIRQRKKHLINLIQIGIIKFVGDEYLSCRLPLGVASESRFNKGDTKNMWSYTMSFKNCRFEIKFTAQIRANMAEIFLIDKKLVDKKKEVLIYIDQTLQHPRIFFGPGDILCNCSLSRLKNILKYVNEIRSQYE